MLHLPKLSPVDDFVPNSWILIEYLNSRISRKIPISIIVVTNLPTRNSEEPYCFYTIGWSAGMLYRVFSEKDRPIRETRLVHEMIAFLRQSIAPRCSSPLMTGSVFPVFPLTSTAVREQSDPVRSRDHVFRSACGCQHFS